MAKKKNKNEIQGDRFFYSEPSGSKTIEAAVKIINNMEQRSSDMQPFYEEMTPDFIQSIKSEFSYDNPNKWTKISEPWRRQKIREEKPENIGIYTGALLEAATTDAVLTYFGTGMTWKIGDVYSIDFTRHRKIGITTREFLRTIGKKVRNYILGR